MKEGEVVLVSGVSFLAKAIKFFQRIYMKREKIKSKVVFNHAGIIIIRKGAYCVTEMVVKNGIIGLFVQPYSETYEGKTNHIITTPVTPLTELQLHRLNDKVLEYQDRSVRYGFWDIALQVPYSLFGRWLKKKGNDKRQICTEFVANCVNAMIPGAYPHPESTNPTEVWLCKEYKISEDFLEIFKTWRTK